MFSDTELSYVYIWSNAELSFLTHLAGGNKKSARDAVLYHMVNQA